MSNEGLGLMPGLMDMGCGERGVAGCMEASSSAAAAMAVLAWDGGLGEEAPVRAACRRACCWDRLLAACGRDVVRGDVRGGREGGRAENGGC